MADVELVIKIDEEIYQEAIKSGYSHLYDEDVANAVANGTPLKHHGKLIDADEVVKEICRKHKVNSIYELSDELRTFIKKYLSKAPMILKPTPEYMIKNYAFFRK